MNSLKAIDIILLTYGALYFTYLPSKHLSTIFYRLVCFFCRFFQAFCCFLFIFMIINGKITFWASFVMFGCIGCSAQFFVLDILHKNILSECCYCKVSSRLFPMHYGLYMLEQLKFAKLALL